MESHRRFWKENQRSSRGRLSSSRTKIETECWIINIDGEAGRQYDLVLYGGNDLVRVYLHVREYIPISAFVFILYQPARDLDQIRWYVLIFQEIQTWRCIRDRGMASNNGDACDYLYSCQLCDCDLHRWRHIYEPRWVFLAEVFGKWGFRILDPKEYHLLGGVLRACLFIYQNNHVVLYLRCATLC